MCGIAGIYAYRAAARDVSAGLRASCQRMSCRGPDGEGLWADDAAGVALAHRRLAIIDLSPRGRQPMVSPRGTAIAFNGEIYNYRALRARLERQGHRFVSDSDTEVLLYLYETMGTAMFAELRGMYAIALWDPARRGLLLARDPFGIKPLYYADDGGTIRAASEVKSLLCQPEVDRAPDPAGRVGFFLWGHVPDPFTLYRGVRSVPAGSHLWVQQGGRPTVTTFADLSAMIADTERGAIADGEARGARDTRDTRDTRDARETEALVREALVDSVRHHLVADVDVGVFLSSGLDSTTLAALAGSLGGSLRTVTLGFEEYRGTPADETPLAEVVARRYGARHDTVWVTRADFRGQLDLLLDRMDQPTIDGVNSFFVATAAAAAGLKVALSGLGGDELFGGYPSFTDVPRAVATVGRVPMARTLGRGFRALSAGVLKRLTSPKYAGLLEYGGDYGGAYLLRRGLFLPWELAEFLDPDLVRAGWAELETFARLERTHAGIRTPRLKVSALEASWYMRHQLLRDTDWASMSHSVEVRVPLVDWTLWRTLVPLIAAGAPVTKRTMAAAAQPELPAAVLDRGKTGFSIPTRTWLQQDRGTAFADRGLRGWARYVYTQAA